MEKGAAISTSTATTRGGHLHYGDLVMAAELMMKSGAIGIVPSDSCYAVAADARSAFAVQAARDATGLGDAPLSVAFSGTGQFEEYADLRLAGGRLMTHLLPGPLTIVSPMTAVGSGRLGSTLNELGTIGGRIPDSAVEKQLAEAVGAPVTTAAIRDDRGDLLTDFPEAMEIASARLIDAGLDPDAPPTVFGVRAESAFTYSMHSTVVDIGHGIEHLSLIREGQLSWTTICESAHTYSSWEVSEWT